MSSWARGAGEREMPKLDGWERGVGLGERGNNNSSGFLLPLEKNIHQFHLISLLGLTLCRETSDDHYKLQKTICVKASWPLVIDKITYNYQFILLIDFHTLSEQIMCTLHNIWCTFCNCSMKIDQPYLKMNCDRVLRPMNYFKIIVNNLTMSTYTQSQMDPNALRFGKVGLRLCESEGHERLYILSLQGYRDLSVTGTNCIAEKKCIAEQANPK